MRCSSVVKPCQWQSSSIRSANTSLSPESTSSPTRSETRQDSRGSADLAPLESVSPADRKAISASQPFLLLSPCAARSVQRKESRSHSLPHSPLQGRLGIPLYIFSGTPYHAAQSNRVSQEPLTNASTDTRNYTTHRHQRGPEEPIGPQKGLVGDCKIKLISLRRMPRLRNVDAWSDPESGADARSKQSK